MSRNSAVAQPSLAARIFATIVPFKPTGSADILQGFRPLAGSMDGMTPCIAEAARRLLRTEGCTLEVTPSLAEAANELALHISDALPSLLREPEVSSQVGWTYVCIKKDGELIARIGGPEPSLDACWIPDHGDQLSILWSRFIHHIRDLVSAGYPGCVGCGGPGSEGPWDETASRAHAGAMLGGT